MTFREIRDRADRARSIPLQALLLLTGAQRDHYDTAKWHTDKGAVSLTGMRFFNWNQRIGGGGAIDLAMHLNGLDFREAVEWLCNHFPYADHRQPVHPPRRSTLILPPPDPSRLPGVKRYLMDHRAIPTSLIQPLIESGTLYADKRGNAVFLLHGKEHSPVGAELRGTTPTRWRGMAPGSQKDLGYFSASHPPTDTVVLCESAIDAISCLALYPGRLCISTSGARPNPRWLPLLIRQGYEIYCGFDSDPTGENMAHEMMALHPGVKRLPPSHHDWNDALTSQQILSPPSQATA